MRYYLDFDRTLFDTDSFVSYLESRVAGTLPDLGSYADFQEAMHLRIAEGTLDFAPGELSHFLYPDAASFLHEKGNAVTIITGGNKIFQEAKVKSAIHGIPRMSVMYTEGVLKGEYLKPHTHLHTDALAIDDSEEELASYAVGCPGLTLMQMRRDGAEGAGQWPVIRSLGELAAYERTV